MVCFEQLNPTTANASIVVATIDVGEGFLKYMFGVGALIEDFSCVFNFARVLTTLKCCCL